MYPSVLGLGESADDVVFTSSKGVYSTEGCYDFRIGALDSFWRSAENFKVESNFNWWPGASGFLWSVSQAAPLRRVHSTNDLLLFQYMYGDAAGFSSGGYISNSQIDGVIQSGSQQQFMSRNNDIKSWNGGVWNIVNVGTNGAPPSHCGNANNQSPYVTVDKTTLFAEKPFISITSEGKYNLNVPAIKKNSSGSDIKSTGQQIGFENVYVATDKDTAAVINSKLAAKLHIVLSPGIYNLEDSLRVSNDNQIILGLGLATLIPTSNKPVITVDSGIDGVRIGGLLLQAGKSGGSSLLQWGLSSKIYAGSSENPSFLYDVFARVGGPDTDEVSVDTMIEINSGFVIGDNFWLWRADHDVEGLVMNSKNKCNTGLIVNANDVTMYGLAVEHTLQDLTIWNGERGSTFYYQAEFPYDVTQANYGDKGYTGYRVSNSVTKHQAYGIGVYHFFRDAAVIIDSGIIAPSSLESSFISPLGVYLNGSGVVNHILNEKGGKSSSIDPVSLPGAHVVYLCNNTFYNNSILLASTKLVK